ncbi:hypothetical protein A1351_08570 [Methylosinus sp. R-45379]|uniref:hypothetical protein n=1 Tax=Methylosinus sp. R-45379 TaxID=980563 RepID=UPI0007C96438|nr:hypothetical protein [Methylosinus sp. R-45379]OAI30545.1 hypothetical protein A1351_08570 [Methylosinus sp. R-45379]
MSNENDLGPMPDYSKFQEMLNAGMSTREIKRILFFEPALANAKEDDPHIFGIPSVAYGILDNVERNYEAAAYCAEHGTDWRAVASEWTGWDAIDHDTWKKLFKRDRVLWSVDILSDEQRAFYDSLPEQLTIYRGCNTGIRNGHRRLAWTLDMEIARDFSNKGIRGVTAGGSPVIYKGTIAKRNVALAIDDREEKEIVPFTIRSIREIGVEHI